MVASILVFLAYVMLGMLVSERKLHGMSEEECRRKYWSPLQSVAMILLWPIFLFRG